MRLDAIDDIPIGIVEEAPHVIYVGMGAAGERRAEIVSVPKFWARSKSRQNRRYIGTFGYAKKMANERSTR